jgi:predicted dehydrogenase
MIRVVLIGVSHWHLRLYLNPLLERDDVTVVGVSDPSTAVSRAVADELGCVASTDYRDLCTDLKPDFVFALGRHCDMAAEAAFLIENDIPFAIEKPAGLDGQEVRHIAGLAAARDSFAAVPFVFRQSDYVDHMIERAAGARFDYLSFTMIGRPPQQYERAGCEWMLDRATSGGGAMINLGIHFLDLLAYLQPDDTVEVTGASVSSAAWGYSIEDFATVTLRAGTSVAQIQTGYIYTSPEEYMDLHFSVRSASAYHVVRDPHHVETSTPAGGIELLELETTNVGYYPRFVNDVIDRFVRGDRPVAGLAEAAAAMGLLDDVYAKAGAVTA